MMSNEHGNAAAQGRGSRPRVVMLLANDFTHDTRVFKEARSLIEWGCEVHVIATARTGLAVRETVQDIHIHRVPTNERDMRHVFISLASWWSRSLLRRSICRVERQPSGSTVPAQEDGIESVGSPVAGTSRNGKSAARQPTPAPVPTPMNRSLPARAWRRSKVYGRRLRIRMQRLARWVLAMIDRGIGRLIWLANGIWRRIRGGGNVGRTVVRSLRQSVRRWTPATARLLSLNHRHAAEAIGLDADVVVAHDLNMLLGAMMVRRVSGAPVVYDSHELYLERNIGDRSRFMDRLFWRPVEWLFIGRCAAVMTVADGICDHLRDRYGIERPVLVRNVQPYEPPAPRTSLLADELDIAPDKAIVLYPGAVTINRGLEQMIDSSVYLEHAVYVIMGYAGNPAYLESLKRRAEALGVLGGAVRFRHAVPIEDVVRYTASADLGIVPTQNVCLSYQFEASNKIFHCLMAGVPLAMSDHVEKRLIVERYGVGVLFDETDPKAIAEAVNAVLADGQRMQQMRRNCLKAARELNWEHEQHTLRQVFAALLGDRARPVPLPSLPNETPEVDITTETRTACRHEHSSGTL